MELDAARAKVTADLEAKLLDEAFERKRQEIDPQVRNYNSAEKLAQALGMQDGLTTWVLKSAPLIASDLGYVERENMDYIKDSRSATSRFS